ncbi:MAG: arginine repressor, partial [Anaerotignaceae bacterium]
MKITRQNKILEIIETNDIETQEDLAKRLRESGFNVTQATVSRDIRELRLTKIPTSNSKQKYAPLSNNSVEFSDRIIRVFKDAVVSIDHAQNVIVIKTLEGMGMAVGFAIDNLETCDILGSIAGDDTVFCV